MSRVGEENQLGSARKEDKSTYRCLVLSRLSSVTRTCRFRAERCFLGERHGWSRVSITRSRVLAPDRLQRRAS
jgi:hypothetical protein